MSRWLALFTLGLVGCGPLLGEAPPRPPPSEEPTGYTLPSVGEHGGEIVVTARDMPAAEEAMKRRCGGDKYSVSSVSTAEGTSCRGPIDLYSWRMNNQGARSWRRTDRYDETPRNTSRCNDHQDVRVQYRCG